MQTHQYSVLVVGTGIAGLSATLAAHQTGARVGVLERAPQGEHGGNTRYTESFLRMKSVSEVSDDFEDRFHDNAGYNVDPELAAGALADSARQHRLTRTLNFVDPSLVAEFAAQAGPTLEWLESLGVSFAAQPTPFLTAAAPRLSPVGGGQAFIETLGERIDQAGIDVHYQTTARELIIDEDGAVVGLHAVHSNGQRVDFHAEAVILACGGYEGNSEMMSRYQPRANYARPIARGGHYNRGEGIEMALRAGAAPAGDYNRFHAEPIDPRSGLPEAAIFVFPYGVLVNGYGQRFTDEAPSTVDSTYEAITRQIMDQPDGVAYVILDARLEDVPNYQRAIRTDQPPIVADTLEDLAKRLTLPIETFTRTVQDYNGACSDGPFEPLAVDGLATQGLDIPKSNWARPLGTPPFRAYPIAPANVFTFGGLKVDTSARIISQEGTPIRGLYAAGELVGLYFGTYTGSTSVLKGAVFGRAAGRAASA
jgi:tricarballylate dehydrogenase